MKRTLEEFLNDHSDSEITIKRRGEASDGVHFAVLANVGLTRSTLEFTVQGNDLHQIYPETMSQGEAA